MAKGIQIDGADFDDLFDPDVVGDGPSAPALTVDGVALKYAALAYGTKLADIGIHQDHVDVTNLWAAKGTAVYALPFHGKGYARSAAASSGQTGTISASLGLVMMNDGTYSISGSGTGSGDSGRWLPNGASVADYEVMFTYGITAGDWPSEIENTAPNYLGLSTAQRVSFRNSVNAALIRQRESQIALSVHLRKVSTGVVTISSVGLNVYVQGQG